LELVLAWILGGDFGWIWDPFLPLFLGSIFMVLFRSAIAHGNDLFHWVLCDFGQLLSVWGNSRSKLPFVQCPPYENAISYPFASDVFWIVLLPTILEVNLDPFFAVFRMTICQYIDVSGI
jgi:hypothetical protein